jgi:hypothetical protein
MAGKVDFIENQEGRVLCPHCEAELDKVHYKSKGFAWLFGRVQLYFCPYCSKVLGFSQSRMG